MVKNKVLTGSATGIKGFDIRVEGNDIIAEPLDKEFFKFIDTIASYRELYK